MIPEKEYLNIGCGNCRITTAINMDVVENEISVPDIVGDILDIPFEGKVFKGVICSHILEHLDKNNHWKALSEMRRVLKDDGSAYIEVPDLEQFMRNYLENYLGSKDYWYNGVYGRTLYPSDRHLCGFNRQYLTDLLFNCGFGNLKWHDSPRNIASLCVVAHKREV